MRSLLKGKFKLFREQRGFALFEVLIAVAILGVLGVAIIQGLYTSNRTVGIVDEQSTARVLTTEYIESIRQLPYAATYPPARDIIDVPPQYIVVIETECSNDDINWEDCTGNETLQRISVSVFREGGKPVMRICTFRTPRQRL